MVETTSSTVWPDRVEVLIVGGGPGGYSCALRLAELGHDVALVEPGRPGGTCLHAGCIPSKAIIHAAERYREALSNQQSGLMGIRCSEVVLDWPTTQRWKSGVVNTLATGIETLLARAGVQLIRGRGQMLDGKRARVTLDANDATDDQPESFEVQAKHVVISVGAREVTLPSLPASEHVLYAEQVLGLSELPDQLAVVGAGYIGLELGQAFARLGVTVTIVEAQDRLLPAYPKSLVAPVVKALAEDGVRVLLNARAETWEAGLLQVTDGAGSSVDVQADRVLVAVGRKANLDGWGREQLALDMKGGFIAVNRRGETSMAGVYAVGDVTGEPMLAHRAIAQGQVVAESIAGRRREFSPVVIPAVCFTSPEIAVAGLTLADAKAAGHDVVTKRLPLSANGRSLTLGSTAGFIEVVASKEDHVLLGVHAVGAHVAELVHSFTLALEMGARLEDVASTVHAHPTVGESFCEVSQAALGLG